ncbi:MULTISPECIES: chorismate synthase [Bacillales]|jgi:chorismate synthase|uniref:Chorismate synthase n=1 Tax=Brevibacillus aydinogluensis TaxID=927786 RepID=A0AA48M8Z0_9BACL|nr:MULTISPECIES: chorismate synthase [Bacillales]REK62228.1 MAG: chorismate synthase [Brevibacillus sp.]MBR8658552.1 chorismate synthase [Brevibacillus sp. NL20B1]MDT3415378.1 chorismate synthase [Brevibacillus aydinogluensis]NNV02145.1 chorismate synthase [Brevibacillus sp. MCWH]UFJ60463.1 chorismate synthase [Anoxybacillus sediminis]
MRYLTAGESHGPQLTAIIEGVPSNLPFSVEAINEQLARRQKGHGRGRRMQIEKDQVKVLSGVRHGYTTGAPITLVVENKDWTHWQGIMSAEPVEGAEEKRRVSRPRPGHADLNGAIKYHQRDMRNILERSSARETAIRVAVGAVARQLLAAFGIRIGGHVLQIGDVVANRQDVTLDELIARSEESPVRCLDKEAEQRMMAAIDQAKQDGDSLGGIVEVIVEGVPIGLGSHVQWDRKLDGRLAQAIMSIQAFKGVEIGIGFGAAGLPGSQVHDEIVWSQDTGYSRKTNNAGGLEGGMTTGMPIVVRGVMKPIPTLYKPLMSVDIDTKEPFSASIERSDSCAVPAASVVAEAVVAWEIARAMCEKFPSDSLDDMLENVRQYRAYTERF